MAITQLSPGVKVKEIDLTNVVPSVASSIGAYVGDFTWGPVEEIRTISREKELVDVFGKPTKFKAVDFTALSLFLKYTDHAEVVRMVDDTTARNATADTISGGRLIKNNDQYDGLTGFLSSVTNVDLTATMPAKVGETKVTVADASEITGGDIVTGTNITAGTSVIGIDGNVVTLSNPLEGVIPAVAITEDIVEVYRNAVVQDVYAAGSRVLQTTFPQREYQIGALAYHYEPNQGQPAFPDATLILPAVSDFTVGDRVIDQTNTTRTGDIEAISAAAGTLLVDVVAPTFVPAVPPALAFVIAGVNGGEGYIDAVNTRATVDIDTSYNYVQLTTTNTVVTLQAGEVAALVGQGLGIGDTVVGSVDVAAGAFVAGTQYTISFPGSTDFTLIGAVDNNPGTVFTATGPGAGTGIATTGSGVAGKVVKIDAANDAIVVNTNGLLYTIGDQFELGTATATVASSEHGVGTTPLFNVGDTVFGSFSGATGTVSFIDVAQHIMYIQVTSGSFQAADEITVTAGTIPYGFGVVGTVQTNPIDNFVPGDTVTGQTSLQTGVILSIDSVNSQMVVQSVSGAFTVGEEFHGGSSLFGIGVATAFDYKELITLRRVADGSIKLANPLNYNMPATERVLIDQKFTISRAGVIGDNVVYVSDTSHVEIGDELIEAGIAEGALVLDKVNFEVLQLNILEASNFQIGDIVRAAAGGSNATGIVSMIDTANNSIVISPDNLSLQFATGDQLDVYDANNNVTGLASGNVLATSTPNRYQEDVPGALVIQSAVGGNFVGMNVTDEIPVGTVGTNRRVSELDTLLTSFEQEFLVLDTLDGVAVGDEVDTYITNPAIRRGTEIINIDPTNNVIQLNQPTDRAVQLAFNTPLYISRRVNLLRDSLAEATSIFVDHTVSIAPGDSIINITGVGIQLNTKVESVNHATGEVGLDTPISGTIPTAVQVGDILSVDVYRGPWYAKYAGEIGNSLKVEVCGSAADFASWAYKNYFNGAPATSDYVSARTGSNDELHIVVIDEDGKFTGTPGTVLENFGFVSQARDARLEDGTNNYYVEVINQRSNYIYWGAHDLQLVDAGKEAQGQTFTQLAGIQSVSLTEGSDSADIGVSEWSKGFEMYRDVETIVVDFLIQPSIPNSVDGGKSIQDLMIDIAEFRMDCIALLSPPTSLTSYGSLNPVDDVITWFDQINSTSYAVFDSCAIKVYDKYNDQYLWIPASSSVAGVCARTDDVAEPWFSPAGYNRGQIKGVVKLGNVPVKTERDKLYSSRINPLVTFPGEGTILYGDKTALARPSAFDRINVRRLFITLERAISNASKFMLFEFNDATTRQNFIAMVEPFLRNVQGLRGIQDFHVVCDETNNTPYIIDTNQFVGDIYIKPNRSINFINLNFIAVRTGVSFNEIATGLYE